MAIAGGQLSGVDDDGLLHVVYDRGR
jgi:hypothetical protein